MIRIRDSRTKKEHLEIRMMGLGEWFVVDLRLYLKVSKDMAYSCEEGRMMTFDPNKSGEPCAVEINIVA